MRILFLSQFYWPEARTAPTNLATLAEDLQAMGHEVLVITGFPNHPFGRIYEGYRMRFWQWDDVRGVKVLRLPLYPDHSSSAKKRLLNFGSFAISATFLGGLLSLRQAVDVMFVYLPPLTLGLPIRFLRFIHRAPAVYWITDLWPEGLVAAGARINSRLYRLIEFVEGRVYKQAEAFCVTSPGFKQNLMIKGIPEGKLNIIVDWVDGDKFFPSEPDGDLAKEFRLAGKFNIIYGGNLGPAQGLSTVIRAAQKLEEESGVQFVFIGDGIDKENLMKLVEELGIRNVIFIPRQPFELMHRFFALADVLLVHLNRNPIYESQIPSKIVAYLACGRPILCAMDGDAAALISELQAGLVCLPESPVELAEKVREMYLMSDEERELMGHKGRQGFLANYTRAVQVARIEKVLKQAVKSSSA